MADLHISARDFQKSLVGNSYQIVHLAFILL